MMFNNSSTPWSEDEEAAFNIAVGKWMQAWFTEIGRTHESVQLGPSTLEKLVVFWTAGREYERTLIMDTLEPVN